ncbi:MAG: hypothetical protein CME64_06100 [Halobacteriovoraceae bacterium]|nr:hypothetical protein [Halobacteriovoraceae bacterium]|tara:strand:- start:125115 stop:125519 length:405 start_codon:yes stop_codon:yes gene_type:complete
MKSVVFLAVLLSSFCTFAEDFTPYYEDYALNKEAPYHAYNTRVPHRMGPRTKWRRAVRFSLDGSRAICSGDTFRERFPLFVVSVKSCSRDELKVSVKYKKTVDCDPVDETGRTFTVKMPIGCFFNADFGTVVLE